MPLDQKSENFDVAIIGGGPAGLNAAVIMARACRRVVLFDNGKPRNYAARAVHGFLAQDGIAPNELRERGRREALSYGVTINDREVTGASAKTRVEGPEPVFEIVTGDGCIASRSILLASGVVDHLPEIPGLHELYGR